MTILFKLFATLREGRGKQLNIEIEENATLLLALQQIGVKKEEVSLILRNGINETSFDIVLSNGDVIALFPPVGGG